MQIDLFYAEETARAYQDRVTRHAQRERQFARLRCASHRSLPAQVHWWPTVTALANLAGQLGRRLPGLGLPQRRLPCSIPS
ncbi:MAG: hypothetical protein KC442_01165 [Thermomicrobiales bacterium]|nr:hypothetical protein [Thermomicrobiales bacterium]